MRRFSAWLRQCTVVSTPRRGVSTPSASCRTVSAAGTGTSHDAALQCCSVTGGLRATLKPKTIPKQCSNDSNIARTSFVVLKDWPRHIWFSVESSAISDRNSTVTHRTLRIHRFATDQPAHRHPYGRFIRLLSATACLSCDANIVNRVKLVSKGTISL